MNTLSTFSIENNHRVFLAGKTGSGKTTLALFLLYNIKRLILIDSKDDLFDWNTEPFNRETKKALLDNEPCRIRVVDREEALEVLQLAYSVGNVIIYLDEVTALIPPRSEPEQVFTDIWTRGRSRNIGAWSTSQRPKSVPLVFMSESEHYFMFRLNLEDDRKRMKEFMGEQVLTPIPDSHGFYYYNIFSNKVIYRKKLNI